MFDINLHNILQEIYYLTTTMGFASDYVESMIPMERNLYISYYLEDMRKQEQKTKGQYDILSGDIPAGMNTQDIM